MIISDQTITPEYKIEIKIVIEDKYAQDRTINGECSRASGAVLNRVTDNLEKLLIMKGGVA